jgi:Tol biopolymer transport system component
MWTWPATRTADKPDRVLLSQPGINFWQGNVSPNGRWLVFLPFSLADPGVARITVAPADGGPPDRWVRIAPDSQWTDKPRWSPDGRLVYFISKANSGFFNLSAVRFDPERGVPVGAPFAVTHFESPSLAITPEMGQSEIGISAHRAMLTMVSRKGSIWMLDNVDR